MPLNDIYRSLRELAVSEAGASNQPNSSTSDDELQKYRCRNDYESDDSESDYSVAPEVVADHNEWFAQQVAMHAANAAKSTRARNARNRKRANTNMLVFVCRECGGNT